MDKAIRVAESVAHRSRVPTRNALTTARRALPLWAGIALALLLALTAAACGRAQKPAPATQDGFSVTFATEPATPKVGDGVIVLKLVNPAGQAVDNARVEVEANMSHAGMVPVKAQAPGGQAGAYRIPLRWTMAGDWYVDVRFTLPDGGAVARRFPVTVR